MMTVDTATQRFEARMQELEGEVEGEKRVTRHVLEQARLNGADLATMKLRMEHLIGEVTLVHAAQVSQTARLNVLTQDVTMLRTAIGRIEHRLDGLDQRMSGVEHRLEGVEHRLEGVEHRLDGVEHRLDGVEHRLDGVEHRLDGVAHRLDRLEQRMDRLEQAVGSMREDVAAILAMRTDVAAILAALAPRHPPAGA